MKHGSNPRRGRSRGNGKRHPASSRSQSFESSGPEVKIRGSAQQVQEKYLNLARDAFSAGDRIAAEGYFQHAEHYYRLANPYTGPNSGSNAGQEADQGRDARPPKVPPVRESEAENEAVAKMATGAKAEVVADAPADAVPATAVNVPIDVAGDAGAVDKSAAPKRRSRGRKPAKVDASDGGAAAGDEDAAAAGDSEKKPIPAV
jgi:hypothetical protein